MAKKNTLLYHTCIVALKESMGGVFTFVLLNFDPIDYSDTFFQTQEHCKNGTSPGKGSFYLFGCIKVNTEIK